MYSVRMRELVGPCSILVLACACTSGTPSAPSDLASDTAVSEPARTSPALAPARGDSPPPEPTATEPAEATPPPCTPAPARVGDFSPSPLYENLFVADATFVFGGEVTGEEDDYGLAMTCQVGTVRRLSTAVAALLRCDAVDDSPRRGDFDVPREASPDGVYVATAQGLYRTDAMPRESDIAKLSPTDLVMLPDAGECIMRDDQQGNAVALYRSEVNPAWWCSSETSGDGDEFHDGQSVSLCFRRGAGLVAGGYHLRTGERLHRGHYQLGALTLPKRARSERALVINEVTPAGQPVDWFEVVNVSTQPVQLDDFVYTDRPISHASNGSARVVAFPSSVLQPGAYHVQRVTRDDSGFALSSTNGETLAVHRAADLAAVDEFEWPAGVATVQGSFARTPDIEGAFVDTQTPTPGQPNALATGDASASQPE